MRSAQMAVTLFCLTSGLALGFCLLAGVFLTSDCLSEERREGTLGLLFLTPLRGYDVVLGKLVATSLPSFYGLLTVFPVLALPLLMGGISVGEFWRMALVLVVTLAFSLCLGLAISAFSREARQAMSATLLLILLIAGMLPLLGGMQRWFLHQGASNVFFWPSPAYAYSAVFDTGFNRGRFWGSLSTVAALAAMALAFATIYLPRTWRESGEVQTRRKGGGWLRRLRFGDESYRAGRRLLLTQNPYYWLATRDRLARWLPGVVLFVLFVSWLACVIGSFSRRVGDVSFGLALGLAVAMHIILKWFIAAEASRRFNEDSRSGALELLLVTPLPVKTILEGQRQALWWNTYFFPLVCALTANLGFLCVTIGLNPSRMGSEEHLIFCELFLGGAVVLLMDARALTWVGMSLGIRGRAHHRAILGTLGRVLLAPWFALIFLWLLGVSGAFTGIDGVLIMFFFWYAFVVVLDVVFAQNAQDQLRRELRPR